MPQLAFPADRIDDALAVSLSLKAGTGPASMHTVPTAFPALPPGTTISLTNGSDQIGGSDTLDFSEVEGFGGFSFTPDGGETWFYTNMNSLNEGETVYSMEEAWGGATGDYEIYNYAGSNSPGLASRAEGTLTVASGDLSHAEGQSSVASGFTSHAEGLATTASQTGSHSEGDSTVASGPAAHAEGSRTVASGPAAHAAGDESRAEATNSSAGGRFGHARYPHSRAQGGSFEHYASASLVSQVVELQIANEYAQGTELKTRFGQNTDPRRIEVRSNGFLRISGQIVVRKFSDGTIQSGAFAGAAQRPAGGGGATVQNFAAVWDGGASPLGALTMVANGNDVRIDFTPAGGVGEYAALADVRMLEVGPLASFQP